MGTINLRGQPPTKTMSIVTVLLTAVLVMQPPTQTAPPFSARLLAANASVQPGGQTELLVEINLGEPWHLYHPVVLDTGLPTTIEFTAPRGVTIGEPRFPAPALGETAGLEYLALSGKIRCIAPLTVATDAKPGQTLTISAGINGLACIELCVLVEATATLKLPVTEAPGKPVNEELFKEAREALAPGLADAPYLKGSGLRVSRDKLGIDEPAELIATIRVQQGHHIQDRDPGVEGLIGARLFVEHLPGIELAEKDKQIWPQPHVREIASLGKVRELSGQFEIRVPFEIVDKEFPSGPVTIHALFRYQACTDAGACFPPEMATGSVHFEAVTPNSATAEQTTGEEPGLAPPPEVEEPIKTSGPGEVVEHEPAIAIPRLTAEDWAEHIPWQPWRPGLAEELSRLGHRVYVDYTATWCLTCQANKRLVLETDTVRTKMRELGVIPIEADFTNRSPEMYAEIKAHGNNTVPLNLVYAPGHPDHPGKLPALLTKDTVLRALEDPLAFAGDTPAKRNLLLVMLFGFLGGLILNVMPCVLPVISIKILSFVQQAGEDPKRVLRLGLAFCAGIMVWFWAFAALSKSGNIPWQYPEVIIVLSSVILVFALSLFGVFEIVMPGRAAGKLDALVSREGYSGAFFKGLLATLLGTACTAPFLALAAGYAITQPAGTVFLVFTAAGLGMASPYLLLSANPAWMKFIPRPGAWMVTFKQASGFLLVGTAIWLLTILAEEVGGRGVVWTVAFWSFLSLAVWMLGKIKPTWRAGSRAVMWLASLAVVLFGVYFCYFVMSDWTGRKTENVISESNATPAAMNDSPASGNAPSGPSLPLGLCPAP